MVDGLDRLAHASADEFQRRGPGKAETAQPFMVAPSGGSRRGRVSYGQCRPPLIGHASVGAREYAGAPYLRQLILAEIEEWLHITVVMHQLPLADLAASAALFVEG